MTYLAGDLRIPTTEEFGPKLNPRTVAILHPDMHQTSQDAGRERVSQRRVDRSTWLPDEHLGNLIIKDVHEVNINGDLVVKSLYEHQKVGPGEPLAPVAERLNELVIHEELNSVYLKGTIDHPGYSHDSTAGEPAQEEGKVLYSLTLP